MSETSSLDLGEVVLGAGHGRHAFETCVERLATAIRLGVYAPGRLLPPERELAATMGVSRATLREAIAALRSAGMVRTTRGRGGGTVIDYQPVAPGAPGATSLTGRRADLLDSLRFRRIVEPGAAQVAAGQDLSWVERTQLTDALRAVTAVSGTAEHRQADSRFHLAIASVTNSPRLITSVTGVQADLHDMLLAIPVLPINLEHSNAQHAAILEAVLAGEEQKARRVMEDHCDDTAALLRGLMR
jgi:GntR family transcriptional regulator, transcriptional repressor for pyruvate dehydrogenase complex